MTLHQLRNSWTLFGIDNNEEEEEIKRKHVERFYLLLYSLMNELFEYAPKSGHVKIPYNVTFGFIHDKRDSELLKGNWSKNRQKIVPLQYKNNCKDVWEKEKTDAYDNTTNTLLGWIADLCSLYVRPFVY